MLGEINSIAALARTARTPDEDQLARQNRQLAQLDALDRIEWAFARLPGDHVLTSSFGAQAAVTLHLVTRLAPRIPVILVDTGYLFPETYRYIDALTELLDLNLHVYRAERSAAWQEARHGRRWRNGLSGLDAYNDENKVEPMRRALHELGATTWISGLRRAQSRSRTAIAYLERAGSRWKLQPIADWGDRDVHHYLAAHSLPPHPLTAQGYLSLGDTHSTRALHEVTTVEEMRFFGLKRECGIHEIAD